MPDLHEIGVGVFIFFSVLSLVLGISKPVAKDSRRQLLSGCGAFKRIQADGENLLQSSNLRDDLSLYNKDVPSVS
jgi:hypothetical protein